MRFKALLNMLLVVCFAKAQLVTNGSVSGAPCANSGINVGNAAGWSGCGFSPDLCCLAMPSYVASSSVTPVVSPDGGTWLGLAALGECAQTTITGLTAGTTYTLYFCGACFGTGTSIYNQGPSLPRISVVGSASVTVNIPMTASTWYRYQLVFVANAATMTLRCDHLTGSVSYASLDGFSLNPSAPCGPIVLPIELVSFGHSYDKVKKQTQLFWTTSMEKNVKHFIIEKSYDAIHFITAGIVEPYTTESNSLKNYQFKDDNTTDKGIVYYRLQSLDKDGEKTFSNIIDVEITDAKDDLKVYPNPVSSEVSVSYYSETGQLNQVSCYNSLGQLVFSKEFQSEETGVQVRMIDVSLLPTGIYKILISNQAKTSSINFSKQN